MVGVNDNVALVRRFYDEVYNHGEVAFADEAHAPDYRYHDTTNPDEVVDHATFMARNAGFAAAFPDRRVDIDDIFGAGDRAVARATLHATQTGNLGDIGPTGKPVRLTSTIIYRFEGNKIAEEWEIFDALGMYRQLGVAPPG
ncbi:MAG TPA: ester cyclase [Acidimicrobiales bacterium]|nr:ester cyclase [Acidimicrobiales bacterium]